MKEGAGISQRMYMKDPWTRTTVRGMIMEVEGGLDGGGQRKKK